MLTTPAPLVRPVLPIVLLLAVVATAGPIPLGIEMVFGQLAERFRFKRTWAQSLWHLSHRVIRKVLA